MLKPKPITYSFRCLCCNKETAAIFNENEYIAGTKMWPYYDSNPEWDDGFIHMMCAHCGSIMKMHINNINKSNYKPSPWHKPSILRTNLIIIKNYFHPKQNRTKKKRGRFR